MIIIRLLQFRGATPLLVASCDSDAFTKIQIHTSCKIEDVWVGITIETFLSFTHTTESAEILHLLPNKEVFRQGGWQGGWRADGRMAGGWADARFISHQDHN